MEHLYYACAVVLLSAKVQNFNLRYFRCGIQSPENAGRSFSQTKQQVKERYGSDPQLACPLLTRKIVSRAGTD